MRVKEVVFPVVFSGFQEFVNALENEGFKVVKLDERLTTRQAEGLIVGNRKQSAAQDAVAAMIILQSYFDTVRPS